jgi:transcriptional regulator with XRE-family HTH domain
MESHSFKDERKEQLVALGIAVRLIRKEHGLSQEALADHAGIDRSHMGRIERGQRNVSLQNVFKVAAALGCRPSELFARAGL